MRKPEEIKDSILPKEYVLEHGVNKETLCDEYYIDDDNKQHYGEMFDKPMDEGGKPFTGIAYTINDFGVYFGYTEYKDGWQYGAAVSLYASGQLKSYSFEQLSYDKTGENDHYCGWYENGILMEIKEYNRKDNSTYFRSKTFDETGRLVKQSVKCELDFEYNYDLPDPKYEVSWHENGEFRSILDTAPVNGCFYAGIELDEDGCPVGYTVNPNYYTAWYPPEREMEFNWKIKYFDDTFRYEGEYLYHLYSTGWLPRSDGVFFRDGEGRIEKLLDYDKGLRKGRQMFYYPDGHLREEYYLSNGAEYARHIWWHENGVIKRAVIYPRNGIGGYECGFDRDGKLLNERMIAP